MRTVILSLAAAAAAVATPAVANEARVEARGGVFWGGGVSEATIGAAAGYDFDLSETTFVGVEVSADKVLTSAANRVAVGFTGRIGVKPWEKNKLFFAGGYTTKPCEFCVDSGHAGAGWEHDFGPVYGKVEYRHFFTKGSAFDADTVVAGIGINF